MDVWRICEHCGAKYATLANLQAHMSGPECLKFQLAAANERANTGLGEMVRLQERCDGFEVAREAWQGLSPLLIVLSSVSVAPVIILDAYFATGEKEG
jgi:hypothetical protein